MAEGGSTSSSDINSTVSSTGGGGTDVAECQIDIDPDVWSGYTELWEKESAPQIPKAPEDGMKYNLKFGLIDIPFDRWTQPSVISIGPYHYGSPKCQKMQNLKFKSADRFFYLTKQDRDVLYKKITEKTPELRTCYDTQKIKGISERKLATIFLLDGCFLLHFINYLPKEHVGVTYLDLTIGEITNMQQDLFLLENQLPFKVLNLLLLDASRSPDLMQINIGDFVASQAPISRGISDPKVNPWECFHLLHYLSATLSQKHTNSRKENDEDRGINMKPGTYYGSCRTVQELRNVGVSFKPSPTGYFSDISFKPGGFGAVGCLQLPTITLNAFTVTIFLNLIAFESSFDTSKICHSRTLGVISYLCFMDSLIDTEDDVKELQAAGILHNSIGGTKEVAHFFNTVCSYMTPNPSYRDVILDIERHFHGQGYKSRWRRWYVELKQQYFSSPWSCIALLAAILALSLTAIQAFTSLYPRQSGK